MSIFAPIRSWWNTILHCSRSSRDVEDEFRFHVDSYAADLVLRGVPPEEAARKARVELGRPDMQQEKYREAIGLRPFDEMGTDLRYGLRSLRKNPGFSAVVIISLTLGIGATTAMFSLIYATLLHPFPYADANRIVDPTLINEEHPQELTWFAFTKSQFQAFRRATAIDSLLGFDAVKMETTGSSLPEDIHAIYLTENASTFFGVPAMLGRGIQPSDAARGSTQSNVAVLNYKFWRRHYDGDKNVVGKTLQLDHNNYTIIGVMPRSFAFNDNTGTGDVYLPWSLLQNSKFPILIPWIKLKPGISHSAANAEFQALLDQFAKETPKHFPRKFRVQVQSLIEPFMHNIGHTLALLFAAVVMLLVIGCANCSILLLARGTARHHEFAVRSAIGASRFRIVRQLAVESLVLSITGSVLGIALAYWLARLPLQLLPNAFPHEAIVTINLPMLCFSIGLALVTGALFGLAPAFRVSRPDVSQVMQSSVRKIAGHAGSQRTLSALIASQIALTLVLLAAAGAAIGGFIKLMNVSLGYDPHNVMAVSIPLHWNSHKTWEDRVAYISQLREKIASLPNVISVAVSPGTPPSNGSELSFSLFEQPSQQEQKAQVSLISPQYFRMLHIPILRGRLWSQTENMRSDSVAVINQDFANRYWPSGNAIGQQIRVPGLKDDAPLATCSPNSAGWRQIIGIVGNARDGGLNQPLKPEIYVPYTTYMWPDTQFLVRTETAPLGSLHSIRAAIQSVDSDQQVSNGVRDLEGWIKQQPEWATQRLLSILFGFFSGMALILALIGLYSVVSYGVTQRTNEFGIRMALGAQRENILWIVIKATALTVGSGIAVGLLINIALQKLLTRWVAGSMHDPRILAGVTMLLIACAMVACLLPAHRAMSIEPMQALRCE